MKKILLSAVALFAVVNIFGQTEQGKILVGASSDLSFTFQNGKQEFDGRDLGDLPKTTAFEVSPSIGYFVVDNLAIGLGFSLATQKTKEDENTFNGFGVTSSESEFTQTTFAIGPFLRYYFLQNNIKPFIQGSVAYASQKRTFESGTFEDEDKANGFAFGFDAGVAFFLNDFISLDLGLGYARTTVTPNNGDEDEEKSKSKLNTIGANVGFNLFF